MSRHVVTIVTPRGSYVLATGVDPPTGMMFVQLWGPGSESDEVRGGPGQESDGTWLLLDRDCENVDELEQALNEQQHLRIEEAYAAFGTELPDEPSKRTWYNDRARLVLGSEQRAIRSGS